MATTRLGIKTWIQNSHNNYLFTAVVLHEWPQLSLWLNVSLNIWIIAGILFVSCSCSSWHPYKSSLRTLQNYLGGCLFFISSRSIKSSRSTVSTLHNTPPHAYRCAAFITQFSACPESSCYPQDRSPCWFGHTGDYRGNGKCSLKRHQKLCELLFCPYI